MAAENRQLMLWETEVRATGVGQAVVTARKPASARETLSTAEVLELVRPQVGPRSRDWVHDLVRRGVLKATKPGAVAREARKDRRASNAPLAIRTDSVLDFLARLEQHRG